MPSADVVSGIFWMNWRESRIIYFFFERKSFLASFVSFPRSKLQKKKKKKEVVGPERSNERISEVSYPMNPYALRTCAVGASCHVLTDLKLNIVEFSVFWYTISWYITRGKMQGTNNFITLQELFIEWHKEISVSSSSQCLLHPVNLDGISNTTVVTDFIFRYFFSSFNYFDVLDQYLYKQGRGKELKGSAQEGERNSPISKEWPFRRCTKISKYTSQGVLEEVCKLNELSTSGVRVWFNNRRQREDSATSTTAVTTKWMMMLLFKPIKSEKVIHVTFNVFFVFLIPSWECHLQPGNDIDEWSMQSTRTTTWNLPGPSGTGDCIDIVYLSHPSPLLCGG